MKSIVPIVMAGVLGIYGLIISVIISTGSECSDPPLCRVRTRWKLRLWAHFDTMSSQLLEDGKLCCTVARSADLAFVLRILQSTARTTCSTGTRTWRPAWPVVWQASQPAWPSASLVMLA